MRQSDYIGAVSTPANAGFENGMSLAEWMVASPSLKARRAVAQQIVDTVGSAHDDGCVFDSFDANDIIISVRGDSLSATLLRRPLPGTLPQATDNVECLGKVLVLLDLPERRIVARCVTPDAMRRYSDAGKVRRAFRAKKVNRAILLPAMLTVPVLALIVVTGVFAASTPKVALAEPPEPKVTVVHDTLFVPMQAPIPESDNVFADDDLTPDDDVYDNDEFGDDGVLDGESPATLLARSVQTGSHKVDVAIAKGRTRMLESWNMWDYKRHLDTLSNTRYLNEDYSYRDTDFKGFPERYVQSLYYDLSPTERLLVYNSLNDEYESLLATIPQKLRRLHKKDPAIY